MHYKNQGTKMNRKKWRKVCRKLASTVLDTIKQCIIKYGDYDDDDDSDIYLHPLEIAYSYTVDGHFFAIREGDFQEERNGIDIAIYYNGDVTITVSLQIEAN